MVGLKVFNSLFSDRFVKVLRRTTTEFLTNRDQPGKENPFQLRDNLQEKRKQRQTYHHNSICEVMCSCSSNFKRTVINFASPKSRKKIPQISRVRGPYCKTADLFFPLTWWPRALRAWGTNQVRENGDRTIWRGIRKQQDFYGIIRNGTR